MRINSQDQTLKKNYIQKYQFLIGEYEEVKAKKHPIYKTAKDFYAAHQTCAQTFLKYYARYKQSLGDVSMLLPGKRGPRYQTRRAPEEIERLVLAERKKGCNKYEIRSILYVILKERTPSASGIYNILKRHQVNRLSRPMPEQKKRIIKEKAGELAHIDCYHLSKDTIANDSRKYYLVCVVDDCTRIAWAEVMPDITALSTMFGTLTCLNHIVDKFGIKFKEVLTDNGPEFGCRTSRIKDQHPFERLLIEMEVKHRYTRPYRPQTNGKVERFWRTLDEDLIEGTYFETIDHFKDELLAYMLYYNKLRPHQSLNGETPEKFHQRIT